MTNYHQDFYTWTQQQAALLRNGRLHELDITNLLEEVEDMGKSQRNQLENRLKQLLLHLLKWHYQPNMRTRSWLLSIKEQRLKVAQVLRKNPGLKPELADLVTDAYELAKLGAAKQTGLDESIFPEVCPWTMVEVLTEDWLP